jgi:hypothetical protein
MIVLAQIVDSLFRNTLAPWQWAILAVIPPAIIALYFLKLKRNPLEVPSTYLWKKSIEDLHVNSLWQRMRKNILLLLQLLLLALIAWALLRPGWQGTQLAGQRFIFVIDNSASMQATDVQGAENRLAMAKQRATALIDQMDSGMTGMIISFANTPRVIQEFTDNRRLLKDRVETIEPTFAQTELKGALELADGLANPGRITVQQEGIEVDVVEAQEATLFVFSDGRFEDVKGFSLGNLKPVYVPIGTHSADNLAITSFATRRNEARPEERQAFVQITNFTKQPHEIVVELSLNGQFLDAQGVEVDAGRTTGLVFPLADASTGTLRASLSYELADGQQQDALPLDDYAYAALNDANPGRVLFVSPGNPALAAALATQRSGRLASFELKEPGFLDTDRYQQLAQTGEYELVIFDQCVPRKMPRANTLFIGRIPPDRAWQEAQMGETDETAENEPQPSVTGRHVSVPTIIDWNRAHPLMAHVELGNVAIIDSTVIAPPAGGDILIDSTAGPLAAIAPRDQFQDAVLGFELVGRNEQEETTINTNWPRMHSFPTFWFNAIAYLAGASGTEGTGSVPPGRPVELKATGNPAQLTIQTPAGKKQTVRRSTHDVFLFHDTRQPGIYKVSDGNQATQQFAVNLLDRNESDIRVTPSQDSTAGELAADIHIGNVDIAAMTGITTSRKELWRPILIAALIVLLVEWYVYNRRVHL